MPSQPSDELPATQLRALDADLADLDSPTADPAPAALPADEAQIVDGTSVFDTELRLIHRPADGPDTTIALTLTPSTIRDLHEQLVQVYRTQKAAAGLATAEPPPPEEGPAEAAPRPRGSLLDPLGPLLSKGTDSKKARAATVAVLVLLLLAWVIWQLTR